MATVKEIVVTVGLKQWGGNRESGFSGEVCWGETITLDEGEDEEAVRMEFTRKLRADIRRVFKGPETAVVENALVPSTWKNDA